MNYQETEIEDPAQRPRKGPVDCGRLAGRPQRLL